MNSAAREMEHKTRISKNELLRRMELRKRGGAGLSHQVLLILFLTLQLTPVKILKTNKICPVP